MGCLVSPVRRMMEQARAGVRNPLHRSHRNDACPRLPCSGGGGGVLMARSRLPFAAVSARAGFSPTVTQWEQIERAYGHPFSAAARQAIRQATINFLLLEPFERAAKPISLARKRVLAVQKAFKAAHDALVAAPATTASVYAHYLIKRHLTDETLWGRKFRGQNRDEFMQLRRLAVSYLDACTSALAEL